ncbi:cell division protein SepF [Nakamurella flava]|uniref:Cell division protein SepF n=1 Tax=Nakamurella flava TaxID=2576308 RepID=A0A4V6Y6S4_9ACTN|nr:cell division protein SepF [Nakamurella flava]
MSSWRKVGAFLGLTPEDGRRDQYADEYDEHGRLREEYEPVDQAPAYDQPAYTAPAYSTTHGRPAYEDSMTQGALAVQPRAEVRRDETAGAIRPVTIKLNGFSEARVIGEKYREGKPVILDMTEMDDADARRLVDFAAGLAFALRGSIDKVTTKVFMLLPPDTDVAEFSESLAPAGAGEYDTRRPAYAGR